jgi:aerobic-type carbon monoxide dehydrogenase small subunit (CoxS/CutS family)
MRERKEEKKREPGETIKDRNVIGTGTTSPVAVTSLPVTAIQTVPAVEGLASIKLIANGRAYIVQVEPNWTLRDVLREKLGLTSIKDFCSGYGACGSCTVIMDGRPILSCTVLAIECDGAIIETAEGIAASNHPLVEAFIMNWAAQCGYCVPGFLVTAKALLDRNPDPTVDEIKEALSGNLCRCGNYQAQIKAVLEAAKKLTRKN